MASRRKESGRAEPSRVLTHREKHAGGGSTGTPAKSTPHGRRETARRKMIGRTRPPRPRHRRRREKEMEIEEMETPPRHIVAKRSK